MWESKSLLKRKLAYNDTLEKFRITFTANGELQFAPRDQIFSLLSNSNRFNFRFINMTNFEQFFFADISNLILELPTWIWRLPLAVHMDLWNLPGVVYGFSLIKQQLFQKSAQKNVIDELIDKTKRIFRSNHLNFISNLIWDSVTYFTLRVPKRGLWMAGRIVIEKPFS